MSETHGAGIGGAIARVVAETIVRSHGPIAEQHQAARIDATAKFMDHLEQGLAPIIDRVIAPHLDRATLPDGHRAVFEQMGTPTHEFDVILQIIGALGAVVTALFSLGSIELQELVNELRSDYAFVPLSPADLADMVERAIVDTGWAEGEAKKSGISPDNFAKLVLDTGEPPGLEQMLSLWRRGLLDEPTLDRMIAYSRVRLEWLDYVKKLTYSTMSPADAIEGELKGVLDHPTAVDYFTKGGGVEDQYPILLDTAGNPIGVEAALNLLNHGLITEDDAHRVILHSRVNPIFEPMAMLLRHRWLAPFQIDVALRAGTVDPKMGAQWLLEDGYSPDQVEALVTGSTTAKVAAHKNLAESMVAELYEGKHITEQQALAALTELGYDADEGAFILSLYDYRRELSMAQAAIGQVRKMYLVHRITDADATTYLHSLGVDPEAIAQYLAVWSVEAQTELKELTMAQVGDAFKSGFITEDDANARFLAMGYSSIDATILIAHYGGAPPAGSPAAEQPAPA